MKKIIDILLKILLIVFKTILLLVVIYIFTMPIGWWVSGRMTTEVYSLQRTITDAREEAYEVELTGVTQVVMEQNKELESMQKWARTKILRFHFIKDFKDLEPIK